MVDRQMQVLHQRDYFITTVKLKKIRKKAVLKLKKKTEHPRRSVRKNVIDYACEDGCVKVENVKKTKTQ